MRRKVHLEPIPSSQKGLAEVKTKFGRITLALFAVTLVTFIICQTADTGQAGGRGGESGLIAGSKTVNGGGGLVAHVTNSIDRADCNYRVAYVVGGHRSLPDGEGCNLTVMICDLMPIGLRAASLDTRIAFQDILRGDCGGLTFGGWGHGDCEGRGDLESNRGASSDTIAASMFWSNRDDTLGDVADIRFSDQFGV